MDLGKAIASLRKKKGIRQYILADKCNITQAYLSQIENNRKDPNLSTLKILSAELQTPLPVIFFLSIGEDDIPANKKEAFNTLAPVVKHLISNIFNSEDEN